MGQPFHEGELTYGRGLGGESPGWHAGAGWIYFGMMGVNIEVRIGFVCGSSWCGMRSIAPP